MQSTFLVGSRFVLFLLVIYNIFTLCLCCYKIVQLFSKNQIHVVDGDQFVYDPLSELQKIEDFLGLPSHINRDNFTYNTTKGFYCIRTEDNGQRCLNKNKGRKHPDIHPLVIQKLRRFYDPYNKYFYKLVGRKFAWPG